MNTTMENYLLEMVFHAYGVANSLTMKQMQENHSVK